MNPRLEKTSSNLKTQNTLSKSEGDELGIKTEKSSSTSNDESDEKLGIDEYSSSIYISDSDSSDGEHTKPFCPPSVTQIVNALSAVGTFGGLALIITGGLGMTLNKPVDNAMENIAMVLSGGALMVGSWIGNVAYASHQPA
jgi:hypothetical protein